MGQVHMRRAISKVVFVVVLSFWNLSAARAVTTSWSYVGSPNNPADSNGHGAVDYGYSIATYDVTVSNYVEFLNAKDPSGANSLGLFDVDLQAPFGPITFNSAGGAGARQLAR
jgi:hypothetical protein